LTPTELQALADGEADATARAHLDTCEGCRARLDERRAALGAFAEAMENEAVPANVARRVAAALDRQRPAGATTLRRPDSAPSWPRRVWLPGLAAAAVVVLAVFVVWPAFDRSTKLSAAEVLDRSLQTLALGSGMERLDYEFQVEEVHAAFFADAPGPYRIREVIDHDHPGRFCFSRLAADGTLQSALAEDPLTGMRTMLVRLDGQRYLGRFRLPAGPRLSLPAMGRSMMQTWIGLVQAGGSANLTVVDDGAGRRYVVQAPQFATSGEPAGWALRGARVVVDAADYEIRELDVRGAIFGQPYHVSVRLLGREVRASEPGDDQEFTIAADPDDVVLEGEGTDMAPMDLGLSALGELGRLRGKSPRGH
jgi:hypothetical protein